MIENIFDLKIHFPENKYLLELKNKQSKVPYWGKIWHSAIALATFITENKILFRHKIVLEVAAGLGLPSIVCSKFANQIIVTDYDKNAVNFLQKNIIENNCNNITVQLLDWNNINDAIDFDILLLSDVNYANADLPKLTKFIAHYLTLNKKIFLTTPQRIVATEFIIALQKFIILQKEYIITYNGKAETIFLFQM